MQLLYRVRPYEAVGSANELYDQLMADTRSKIKQISRKNFTTYH